MDNMAINGGKHKKIDLFLKDLNGYYTYETSTNSYKTCKDAKNSFMAKHNYLDNAQVKASFSK